MEVERKIEVKEVLKKVQEQTEYLELRLSDEEAKILMNIVGSICSKPVYGKGWTFTNQLYHRLINNGIVNYPPIVILNTNTNNILSDC